MDLPKETRVQGLHEEPHRGLQSRSPTQPTSRAHTSSPPLCAYNTTPSFYTLLTTLLPAGRNVARAARYEIRRYVFADRRPQYVFPLCYSRFLRDLTCFLQWCRCRSAWMRSRLPFRISLTGTLLRVRVRRRAYRLRLVSQSRHLYRSAREVGCSDVIACPTRSTLSPVLL